MNPAHMVAEARTLEYLGLSAPSRKARSGGLVEIDEVPPEAIERLQSSLHLDDRDILRLLGISASTLLRKRRDGDALGDTAADRLLRVARIGRRATDVFGDAEKAARWLHAPHPILGTEPLALLASDAGTQEVNDELTRIDAGDYA